jgi:hypothetical protein
MPTLWFAALLMLGVLQEGASAPSSGAAAAAPTLSVAETAAISRQIATLRSPVDRSVANGWSDAKKVAELLCRPAALPVLKKQLAGVDRVFLGTDDPKTLTLHGPEKLMGTGSARYSGGWRDFTFTCELDPATAKVTSFDAVQTPAAQ